MRPEYQEPLFMLILPRHLLEDLSERRILKRILLGYCLLRTAGEEFWTSDVLGRDTRMISITRT